MSNALIRCAALALVVTALGLSGCGRRGNLEPAPDSGVTAKQVRAQTQEQQTETSSVDGTVNQRPPKGVTPPKQPFILDPLL